MKYMYLHPSRMNSEPTWVGIASVFEQTDALISLLAIRIKWSDEMLLTVLIESAYKHHQAFLHQSSFPAQ